MPSSKSKITDPAKKHSKKAIAPKEEDICSDEERSVDDPNDSFSDLADFVVPDDEESDEPKVKPKKSISHTKITIHKPPRMDSAESRRPCLHPRADLAKPEKKKPKKSL